MSSFARLRSRLVGSAVVWSWAFNFLRLAGGLLLLPLLLTRLSEPDLGMYYVFLRLVALVPIIDFGFSVSIGRNVSYAAGGAKAIQAQGLSGEAAGDSPNYTLLWQLLGASRRLYALMALGAFVLLGAWGTWNVQATVDQTDNPTLTWVAWGVALIAATFELYLGWWNAFLRGANKVVVAARYAVAGYALQLTLATTLLICGGGLLSLPIGTLVGGLVNRLLSRRGCLRYLGKRPAGTAGGEWHLIRTLWPNSWRIGTQFISTYLGTTVPGLLFAGQFSLAQFAPYGVSMQLMTICSSMAMVWVQVKWPEVGQLRAKQDNERLRRLLWPRWWLQNATLAALAACAILIGPVLLEWIGSGKELLPTRWLVMLGITIFLESQFIFWGTLLSTENRVPYLKAVILTQAGALGLYLVLSRAFWVDYPALIIAPLAAGLVCNYWHWPMVGARSIGTTLTRFILRVDTGPSATPDR